MPIQLPNLDDRTYADLMEEARRLIPTYAPEWTNHNPSDPGITFVELFAYLSEILLYRLNRVTEANQAKFLKLLQGPDWTPSGDLDADTRSTVQRVRERFRAVTAADYERLAVDDFNQLLQAMKDAEEAGESIQQWWTVTGLDSTKVDHFPSKVPLVERTRCVPVRNLERGTEKERTQAEPGHISLVVVPERPDPEDASPVYPDPWHPPKPLLQAVWAFLDERRMLTTRHHVVGPSYAPIDISLVIARTNDALEEPLRDRVRQKLADFLDPLSGGPSQEGWAFGRDVFVSEICEQLEAIPGIDYVTDVMLSSKCTDGDYRCVPASQIWHSEGDLIGLALSQHHIPKAPKESLDPERIVIVPSTSFVPVKVTVTVTVEDPQGDVTPLKYQIKNAVRDFFHPLYNGPGPKDPTGTDLLIADLKDILEPMIQPGVFSLQFQVDSQRMLWQGKEFVGFHVNAGEVINWSAVVRVSTH